LGIAGTKAAQKIHKPKVNVQQLLVAHRDESSQKLLTSNYQATTKARVPLPRVGGMEERKLEQPIEDPT